MHRPRPPTRSTSGRPSCSPSAARTTPRPGGASVRCSAWSSAGGRGGCVTTRVAPPGAAIRPPCGASRCGSRCWPTAWRSWSHCCTGRRRGSTTRARGSSRRSLMAHQQSQKPLTTAKRRRLSSIKRRRPSTVKRCRPLASWLSSSPVRAASAPACSRTSSSPSPNCTAACGSATRAGRTPSTRPPPSTTRPRPVSSPGSPTPPSPSPHSASPGSPPPNSSPP